ncbi:MAG TPA: DNA methyltransferase [Pirellulales bacterium]
MTPQEFIAKWQRVQLSERSACQQHFLDLCDLLGQPKPAAEDPDGAWYTFERGVTKTEGGRGWADVWLRGHFGWEYKGKHKDLTAAYKQLLLYREDLENPPLLVVCDLDRFEIHTNFTGTAKRVYAFALAELAQPANLDVLRKLFSEPQALRPGETTAAITEDAAKRFATIADGMRSRGVDAHAAAHFVMKLVFCMFGEDINLLPEKVFKSTLAGAKRDPGRLAQRLKSLFAAMATGGDYGPVTIPWFNGGLFNDDDEVFELTPAEIDDLVAVNDRDWSSVEPSIFGTLFERSLDPAKRSQIGAHYTSREDILTLLEPVVMAPLRREWAEVRAKCDALWEKIKTAVRRDTKTGKQRVDSKERKAHDKLLRDFVERLAEVTILDPACGSGNFLYVAINLLLDLEKEAIAYAATHGTAQLPHVRPTQLAGLEINPYAQQLAQVVIWIGYLQWMYQNGFNAPRDPILEPIESIQLTDAILDLSDPDNPKEPDWPAANFIIGNPPFLGGKMLRSNLGDAYVDGMFALWDERVPREADLCCYWFEKARQMLERKRVERAGLLATQGIRGGANRKVLERIKATGDIYFAESDRDWILDGANVHVSMVGFDDGTEQTRILDGRPVATVNANLTATADAGSAKRLRSNLSVSFMGDTKGGGFDIDEQTATALLQAPNPHGRPNSDVVVPWVNGLDITRRPRGMWIVDFGTDATESEAALYEAPFALVRQRVLPDRQKNKRQSYRDKWWLHVESRPAMRRALFSLERFVATISVGKHRVFAWMARPTLPDHQLFVFGGPTNSFFGVLHSRPHEVWARAQGTQVRERESGFRYTATTCFDTFPFPGPIQVAGKSIAGAARELDELRNNWLNPPEWTREEVLEFPGSVDGPWARYVQQPNGQGIGTVRYPRLVPKDADAAKKLAKRTLTNLYNERPTWLDFAHKKLDAAVFDAYGWPADLSDDDLLARLLALNLQRAAAEAGPPAAR